MKQSMRTLPTVSDRRRAGLGLVITIFEANRNARLTNQAVTDTRTQPIEHHRPIQVSGDGNLRTSSMRLLSVASTGISDGRKSIDIVLTLSRFSGDGTVQKGDDRGYN